MEWTDKAPTRDGWYWLRRPDDSDPPTIVELMGEDGRYGSDGLQVSFSGHDLLYSLAKIKALNRFIWAGPIAPPPY